MGKSDYEPRALLFINERLPPNNEPWVTNRVRGETSRLPPHWWIQQGLGVHIGNYLPGGFRYTAKGWKLLEIVKDPRTERVLLLFSSGFWWCHYSVALDARGDRLGGSTMQPLPPGSQVLLLFVQKCTSHFSVRLSIACSVICTLTWISMTTSLNSK